MSLMGCETEYVISTAKDQEKVLLEMIACVKKTYLYVRDRSDTGVFMANGMRIYLDCAKFEVATPPVQSPIEVVQYVAAGDVIVRGIAEELRRSGVCEDLVIQKVNTDYDDDQSTTWGGSHESYENEVENHELLEEHMVSHLASRIIFSGAGGFNPFSKGIDFQMSPKVPFLEKVESNTSTQQRPILHLKDEPLMENGRHRFHVMCGESTSQWALWLRLATTAIVLRLIETGRLGPRQGIRFTNPLKAMKDFSGDVTCTKKALTTAGWMRAIDVQSYYLRTATRNIEVLSDWSIEVLPAWNRVLIALDQARPCTVPLCWSLKHKLYTDLMERRGFGSEATKHLNAVANDVLNPQKGRNSLEAWQIDLKRGHIDKTHMARRCPGQTRGLRANGLSWQQFGSFMRLRKELMMMDMRWAELSEQGIFHSLGEEGGLKEFRKVDDHQIAEATQTPPDFGRDKIRSDFMCNITDLERERRYRSDWCYILDEKEHRVLNLSDPYARRAYWQRIAEG